MAANERQPGLFRAGLDVRGSLKISMAQSLRKCPLSRAQVVDKMNEQLEASGLPKKVTPAVLDRWTATSAKNLIPLDMLPVFCRVVETLEPLRVLAAPAGAMIAGPREQQLMKLGSAQYEARRAARKKRLALEALKEIE